MNHRTISAVLTALMTIAATANACDFCNCLYGINPFYNEKNKIAIHFLTQHSSTVPIAASAGTTAAFIQPSSFGRSSIERMMHGTPAASAAGSSEKRRTVELSFQQYLSERIFLTAIIPITSIEMTTTASRTITGNGDVTVLGRYILTDMMLDDMDYTLAAGAGIKLPTGDHSSKEADGTLMDPREQLGTGTIDGIANLFFITNLGTFTAGMDLTAKFNTKDGDDSRIGHSASLNTYLSHDLYRDNHSLFALLGIAGVRVEYAGKDRILGTTDPASGVQSLYLNVGGQIVYDFVKFNTSLLFPLQQNRPDGGADEGSRLFLGMQFEY